MKKIFLAIFFLSLIGINRSFGQLQAGVVLGLDVPVGDFSYLYKPGFCFGLTGKYPLNEKMSLGLNVHYNGFTGFLAHDPYHTGANKAGITAFTGLFQYYFSEEKFKPYAGADLGLYFINSRYYYGSWKNQGGNLVYSYDFIHGHRTALGFAPVGGMTYDISDKLVFDANVKFNLMLTETAFNYIGINLGLFYKFEE